MPEKKYSISNAKAKDANAKSDNNEPEFDPYAGMRSVETAHEKKEHQRRLRIGKLHESNFKENEFNDGRDVIKKGAFYGLVQEEDEQSVQILSISQNDAEELKNTFLMRKFDMPDMLSSPVQNTAMKCFPEGPTVIQQYLIPLILKTDKDLIARSHTGTGKSAAFLIPIIEAVYQEKMADADERINGKDPYAVIFVPTRDLCLQIAQEAKRLAKGTNVKIGFSFGGIEMRDSYRMLKAGCDIVVGTASRMHHLFFGIEKNHFHTECLDFNKLKYLVLDEFDRLADIAEFCTFVLPFKDKLQEKQADMTSSGHRTFMFSATECQVTGGRNLFVNDPIEIVVGQGDVPVASVIQKFIKVNSNEKNCVSYNGNQIHCQTTTIDLLVHLLDRLVTETDSKGYKRVPTTIVFVGTRRASDVVTIWLLRRGFCAFAHNSDRNMEIRLKAIKGVQSGTYDIIVGTDGLCRGINIPGVKNVINMSLPINSPTNYIHRIGRTGRVGNIGRAISFFDVARDFAMATFLEKCLRDCNQDVPQFLHDVSTEVTNKFIEKVTKKNSTISIDCIPKQKTNIEEELTF